MSKAKRRDRIAKEVWAQADAFANQALDACVQAEYLLGAPFQETGSVLASRRAMELSAKAICITLGVDFPKQHHFSSAEIENVLRAVPAGACPDRNFLRVFLYQNLWSWAKPLCDYPFKYGRVNEEMRGLIPREDAVRAKDHAYYCYYTARELLVELQEKEST